MTQEVQRYLSGFRMEQYGVNWVRNLPLVEHVINSTVSLSRGFSPFVLMFGREASLRNDLRLAHPNRAESAVSDRAESAVSVAEAQLSDLESQLLYLHEEANKVLDKEMLRRADVVGSAEPHRRADKVKKGMVVLRHANPNEKSKMGKTRIVWLGPFEVLEVDGDTFLLRDLTNNSQAKAPSRACKIFVDINGNSYLRGLRLGPGGIETADRTRATP